jgi:ABC-type transport system involved in cytochrome c biogenesis permease component
MIRLKGGLARMPSNSINQVLAIFRKEWLSESRTLSGITTTALTCFVSVVIANSITWTTSINAQVSAGLYWLILIFSASITLPRTFLQEEESRTADFWRLVASPEVVFWGKSLFNAIQMLIATTLVSVTYIVMLRQKVEQPLTFILTALGGSSAVSSSVTLAGAIAAPASNRNAVAAAIALPQLGFLVSLGVTGTSTAFGEGLRGGELASLGMLAYAVAVTAIGPVIYARIWKS